MPCIDSYSDVAGAGACTPCPAEQPWSDPGSTAAAQCQADPGGKGHYLRSSGACEVPVASASACEALVSGWSGQYFSSSYRDSSSSPAGCWTLTSSGSTIYYTNPSSTTKSCGYDDQPCICACPAGKFNAASDASGSCSSCGDEGWKSTCPAGSFPFGGRSSSCLDCGLCPLGMWVSLHIFISLSALAYIIALFSFSV